jgi:hypothetical protein
MSSWLFAYLHIYLLLLLLFFLSKPNGDNLKNVRHETIEHSGAKRGGYLEDKSNEIGTNRKNKYTSHYLERATNLQCFCV